MKRLQGKQTNSQGRKEEGRVLGRPTPRLDALERVTGRAKYAADWKMPDMLYARVIMSKIPHGKVLAVDLSNAESLLGVHAILTCLDTKVAWGPGDLHSIRYALTDHVRFVGDVIGAVAATDRRIAEEAAALVDVEYEEYDSVFTVEEAIKPGATRIHDEGNAVPPIRYGRGDVDALMKESEIICEGTYSTPRVHSTPLEPASSLAWWEDGKLTIVAATQGISQCKHDLETDLDLPEGKVRVIAKYKGGGFGNKATSLNYDLICALLSKAAQKPVLIEYSRSDDFIGMHSKWPTVQTFKAGVKKDGTLLAMDLKAYVNIGAYTRHFEGGKFISGPENYYNCPGYRVEVHPVYTNTPATGHMRAPTAVSAAWASECFVDDVAHKLGINPLEFRLKNMTVKYDCIDDYTTNALEDCLKRGAEVIGWREKWHEPSKGQGEETNIYHGLGVSMAARHTDMGRGEAVMRLKKDGTVELAIGVVDIGTGAKSTMGIIAADAFGIEVSELSIVWGDTDLCPSAPGESSSRTTPLLGVAVRAASEKLRDKVIVMAGKQLGISIEFLDLKDGSISSTRGSSSMLTLAQVASNLDGILEEFVVTDPKIPERNHRFSFAAHFAEIAIDIETGLIDIKRYVAVHDSGTIVNPLTAENQVRGSIIMGLGAALTEELIVDDKFGMISNPSLWTYRLPTHKIVPEITVVFIDPKDEYGPKSLGEVGIIPVAPAIGNALFNAIGSRVRDTPMTPDRILRAYGKIS